MAFRFRRKKNGNGDGQGILGTDAQSGRSLLQGMADENGETRFDLRDYVERLFEEAPTRDVRSLTDQGVDAESFYRDEIAPNWDDLSSGQRAAKITAFARLANALESAGHDPVGMGPVVRTKLLVLAWAHDEVYGDEDFLREIERRPDRFGAFELTH